jgi:predicted nucleotidyltransferase
MQGDEPPNRFFPLSIIITPHEADLYDRYIQTESRNKLMGISIMVNNLVEQITVVAKRVFGENTTSEICGSFAKGTEIANSDIDLYIDTDHPVTRAEQSEFVTQLRQWFHNENIHLGRLAIHAKTTICDFDIVCSNTVDYGIRPRPNDKIGNSRVVQFAARGLKVMVEAALPRKLSGYILEDMVDSILTAYPIEPPVLGSGGLQHLISVLQCIVDCEHTSDRIFGLKGGTGQAKALQKMAKMVLHHFLLSHPVRNGLHTIAEICLWMTQRSDAQVITKGGLKIYDWFALPGGLYISNSINSAIYHRYQPSVDSSYVAPPASIDNHHLVLFISHPSYSKYLLKEPGQFSTPFPSDQISDNSVNNLAYLSQCALRGSPVARRMQSVGQGIDIVETRNPYRCNSCSRKCCTREYERF